MISVSGKEWTEIKHNNLKVKKISQDHDFNEIISKFYDKLKFINLQ